MISLLRGTWALYIGVTLLMVGNGLQGTLLGVRGPMQGFSTLEMSAVMASYFAGFLISSTLTPRLIGNVGHIRVFAALGSTISAVLILYPVLDHPYAWMLGRALIGFCFCGVYITAESWLNNATTTSNRGQALSLYMITQTVGIIAAQGILTLGDPAGFTLFIVSSVLVSIAFAPILLTVAPMPAFSSRTRPMSLRSLWTISPLGCIGMFISGGVFSAQFGMSAVYATQAGLRLGEVSLFVAFFYVGTLFLQFPIGWMSDRMDRRRLILACAAGTTVAAGIGALSGGSLPVLLGAAFLAGGLTNPLYALLIAYVNDMIDYEDMAAASGRMLFVNGLGAIIGPFAIGAIMSAVGPVGYWLVMGGLMAALTAYAVWRTIQRPVQTPVDETSSYAPVTYSATSAAMEAFVEEMEASNDDAPPSGDEEPDVPRPLAEEQRIA